MNSPELAALIAEYHALDETAEPARACEILKQAAGLVDRAADPRKWAAFRFLFARNAELIDAKAAIAAYRDALTVFEPNEDRETWVQCHSGLGSLLATQFPPGSDEGEEAIAHLECAINDQPFMAELLAGLYGFRPRGDPRENWQKRVRYLELALARAPRDADPVKWAKLTNELAVAHGEEPGADYGVAKENEIAGHLAALAALPENDPAFLSTCIYLGTVYLDRGQGELIENGREAEKYLRRALSLCPEDGAQRVEILLLLGRCLMFKKPHRRRAALEEALTLFEEARRLAAPRPQPEMRGNVEKFFALDYLELLRLGRRELFPKFLECCTTALHLFDGPTYAVERRRIWQIEADGFLAVEDFAEAGRCCAEAVAVGEKLLREATTNSGRLERIWELRDSSSLLAYCQAKTGELLAALEALERGRTLLWRRTEPAPTTIALADLVPPNGALLFPIFAAAEGVVLIVTREAGAPKVNALFLPHFGKTRVLELQRGSEPATLGGWLYAYCFRQSEPEKFRSEIETIGRVLHHELWTDLIVRLDELAVTNGAELVWFPHGGSGIFPMQAAWQMADGQRKWLLDRYALRFAPSLKVLQETAEPKERARRLTIITNPAGNLPFSVLETEWIREIHPEARVLAGDEAGRDQVLQEFASATDLHLAAHGHFDLDNPFASRIDLARGETLTLEELAPHLRAQRPHFVALSACETAVVRVTSLAEESLGFPAALLAHGVRAVLATQWPVDDLAAALLIGHFYQERAAKHPPAEALRRAQCWLRDVTIKELSEIMRGLLDQPNPIGRLARDRRTEWRGREDEEQPFVHPYFWAAFTLTGSA